VRRRDTSRTGLRRPPVIAYSHTYYVLADEGGSTIVIRDPMHPDRGIVVLRDPAKIDDYWNEKLN
jgi:hypothetical protein